MPALNYQLSDLRTRFDDHHSSNNDLFAGYLLSKYINWCGPDVELFVRFIPVFYDSNTMVSVNDVTYQMKIGERISICNEQWWCCILCGFVIDFFSHFGCCIKIPNTFCTLHIIFDNRLKSYYKRVRWACFEPSQTSQDTPAVLNDWGIAYLSNSIIIATELELADKLSPVRVVRLQCYKC